MMVAGLEFDENDLIAVLAKRLASLGAGIIEFAAWPITIGPEPMIRIFFKYQRVWHTSFIFFH